MHSSIKALRNLIIHFMGLASSLTDLASRLSIMSRQRKWKWQTMALANLCLRLRVYIRVTYLIMTILHRKTILSPYFSHFSHLSTHIHLAVNNQYKQYMTFLVNQRLRNLCQKWSTQKTHCKICQWWAYQSNQNIQIITQKWRI